MKNNFQFFFGLDQYQLPLPLGYFLNQCRLHHLDVYQCESYPEGLKFYAPVSQRKKYRTIFKEIEYCRTVGCLGFLFRQLRQPFRIFLLLWCIMIYQVLSHTIFDVSYQSTSSALTVKIEEFLKEQGYSTPFLAWDADFEQRLKETIREQFETEIAWLEVTRQASQIQISFNDKRYGETKEYSDTPLIATKDAMIVRFDVTHGEKKVKLNEIVHRGDVLVDNVLYNAFNVPKHVYVEGIVWGKTWTTVESSMEVSENLEFLEPFHLVRLLMDCRRQIEAELSKDEKILSENILHFGREGSTITMKVHYTCLEDITSP